ncbi:uncharacterized protein LOC143119461 [Alosa pseudoharengus]|uniref:uncharacterized protein LOC143119461 n=1 Tax=Alosa pseudoharengus TaxID=34774 RepID=UPI003F896D1F
MERRAPQELQEVFGREVLQHTLVVLTCGDYLVGRTAEEYLAKEDQGLREVIALCEGRYHVMNNRQPGDREQVKQLLEKVECMVAQKGGCYVQGVPLPEVVTPGLTEEVVMETQRGVNAERPGSAGGAGADHTDSAQAAKIDGAEALRRENERGERERLEKEREVKEREERERCETEREKLNEKLEEWKRGKLEKEKEGNVKRMIEEKELMSPQKQQLLEQQRTYEDKQQKTKGSSLPTAEGAILSQYSKTSDKKTLKSNYHRITTGEDLSPAAPELRLVLLGGSGSGKSAAGNAILGRKEFESRADTGVTQTCEKGRVILGKKRVAVVDTPDWFRSERTPDEVRSQLSSCVALSTPGPHSFLFCVPLHRPSDAGRLQALGALEGVFGAGAIRGHTLVLFTHADRLKEWSGGVAGVEEYIASKRPDLLKLVEKCGDRYHILERPGSEGGGGGGGEEVERRSVEELLEKVEQTVRESGGGHYSCPLYQEADSRVRDRQAELLQARRERSREHLVTLQEDEEDKAAEVERTRDEAEKSIQLDSVPALSLPPAQFSLFLRSVGEKVAAGARKVPKVLAGGALLGGGLGVFLGGLIGGAVGVTGGVALAEVARRKLSSKQTESDGQKVDEKKES